MSSKHHQRLVRNLLINPRYQMKYIFWITATGLVLIATNAAVFYIFIRENYKILVDMSPMEEEAKVQLYRELHRILLVLGSFSGLFLLMVAIFGLVLSHRTAGPLYHFRRIFEEIQSGNLSARVRLRPKDDFKEVAEECNRTIEYLLNLRP